MVLYATFEYVPFVSDPRDHAQIVLALLLLIAVVSLWYLRERRAVQADTE